MKKLHKPSSEGSKYSTMEYFAQIIQDDNKKEFLQIIKTIDLSFRRSKMTTSTPIDFCLYNEYYLLELLKHQPHILNQRRNDIEKTPYFFLILSECSVDTLSIILKNYSKGINLSVNNKTALLHFIGNYNQWNKDDFFDKLELLLSSTKIRKVNKEFNLINSVNYSELDHSMINNYFKLIVSKYKYLIDNSQFKLIPIEYQSQALTHLL